MNIKDKAELGQFIYDEVNKQLTFTDLRWYRTPEGVYIPSVTTILDAYPKPPAFYSWLKENGQEADVIRDAAGAKGSKVHNLIERYNEGETVTLIDADGKIRYSTEEWGCLEKWVEFCERFNPTILKSEFNLICPELGCAGTIDSLLELDGKRLLVDFKTSNQIHDTYFMQLTAYKKMYELFFPDDPIDGVAIMWLCAKTRSEGKKGQYQGKGYQLLFPEKSEEHLWRLFQSTQLLWTEMYGDSKPRELTYTIEHTKNKQI